MKSSIIYVTNYFFMRQKDIKKSVKERCILKKLCPYGIINTLFDYVMVFVVGH